MAVFTENVSGRWRRVRGGIVMSTEPPPPLPASQLMNGGVAKAGVMGRKHKMLEEGAAFLAFFCSSCSLIEKNDDVNHHDY